MSIQVCAPTGLIGIRFPYTDRFAPDGGLYKDSIMRYMLPYTDNALRVPTGL
jgi:hypothetical protein